MTLHNTQPQHDEVDQLWAMLAQSSGSTADLLAGLRGVTLAMKAVLRHVDELQGEVNEMKTRYDRERGRCNDYD